jgi:cysteine desulfuration protein SufE
VLLAHHNTSFLLANRYAKRVMPERLQAIVGAFKAAPKPLRIQLLLDYAGKVPPLPAGVASRREELEQVTECQAPVYFTTEVIDGRARFHFDIPSEAPTTRGFAGVLSEGLSGSAVSEVLAVPDDFYLEMRLGEVISPLRLRGMAALLARIKAQLRVKQPSA